MKWTKENVSKYRYNITLEGDLQVTSFNLGEIILINVLDNLNELKLCLDMF